MRWLSAVSCGGVQVVEEMERMEEELAKWVQEERKLARNLGIMTAHREMKVREAARCVGKFNSDVYGEISMRI